jgi:hypothetical protein
MTFQSILQISPVFLAGIVLIVLLVNDIRETDAINPHSLTEYLLSFVTSFVVIYWMFTPLFNDIIGGRFNMSMSKPYVLYCMYSILLVCVSPFGILSLRFFLEDETQITYASILAIVSTVFSLYFTFKAAGH